MEDEIRVNDWHGEIRTTLWCFKNQTGYFEDVTITASEVAEELKRRKIDEAKQKLINKVK